MPSNIFLLACTIYTFSYRPFFLACVHYCTAEVYNTIQYNTIQYNTIQYNTVERYSTEPRVSLQSPVSLTSLWLESEASLSPSVQPSPWVALSPRLSPRVETVGRDRGDTSPWSHAQTREELHHCVQTSLPPPLYNRSLLSFQESSTREHLKMSPDSYICNNKTIHITAQNGNTIYVTLVDNTYFVSIFFWQNFSRLENKSFIKNCTICWSWGQSYHKLMILYRLRSHFSWVYVQWQRQPTKQITTNPLINNEKDWRRSFHVFRAIKYQSTS